MSPIEPFEHDPAHERRLEALLASDGTGDRAELGRALADCAACRERYDELVLVRGLLDDAAREERETLASIDWSASVPGTEAVAPFLRAKLAERRVRQRTPWRAGAAAAAAAVVAAFWVVRHMLAPPPTHERETVLGESGGGGALLPEGKVREYTALTWQLALPPGGHFELRVFDDRPGAAREPIVTEERLTESQWNPPLEALHALPERILWEVRVYDATGNRLRTETARLERLDGSSAP